MTQEIVKQDGAPVDRPVTSWSRDQIELIKSTCATGATDDELKLFLYQAQRTGLDPLSNQIYFIKRGGRGTIQTGIDGLRTIAARTGEYCGNDDPVYEEVTGAPHPLKATVTVYRMVGGQRCAFTASARWEEYWPGPKFDIWQKMPYLMLGKCAEALSLRKCFPRELSGIYAEEEMQQDRKPNVSLPPEPAPRPPRKRKAKPQPPPEEVREDKAGNLYPPGPDPEGFPYEEAEPTDNMLEQVEKEMSNYRIEIKGPIGFDNQQALQGKGFHGNGQKGPAFRFTLGELTSQAAQDIADEILEWKNSKGYGFKNSKFDLLEITNDITKKVEYSSKNL